MKSSSDNATQAENSEKLKTIQNKDWILDPYHWAFEAMCRRVTVDAEIKLKQMVEQKGVYATIEFMVKDGLRAPKGWKTPKFKTSPTTQAVQAKSTVLPSGEPLTLTPKGEHYVAGMHRPHHSHVPLTETPVPRKNESVRLDLIDELPSEEQQHFRKLKDKAESQEETAPQGVESREIKIWAALAVEMEKKLREKNPDALDLPIEMRFFHYMEHLGTNAPTWAHELHKQLVYEGHEISQGQAKKTKAGEPLSAFPDRHKLTPIFEKFNGLAKQTGLSCGRRYTSTIGLFDALPLYSCHRKCEVTADGIMKPITREFRCSGERYSVTIQPAWVRVKNEAGKEIWKTAFPREREELVETVLRKIAVNGGTRLFNGVGGVEFTTSQIRKELARCGHRLSGSEIRMSLEILSGTKISLHINGRELNEHILPKLWIAEQGKKEGCYATFNSLVEESLRAVNYRLMNYDKLITLKSFLARTLYKKMVNEFTYAGAGKIWHITQSVVQDDAGIEGYKDPSKNAAMFKAAFKELGAAGINLINDKLVKKTRIRTPAILKSENGEETITVLDYKWDIAAHDEFIGEEIDANIRRNAILGKISRIRTETKDE